MVSLTTRVRPEAATLWYAPPIVSFSARTDNSSLWGHVLVPSSVRLTLISRCMLSVRCQLHPDGRRAALLLYPHGQSEGSLSSAFRFREANETADDSESGRSESFAGSVTYCSPSCAAGRAVRLRPPCRGRQFVYRRRCSLNDLHHILLATRPCRIMLIGTLVTNFSSCSTVKPGRPPSRLTISIACLY